MTNIIPDEWIRKINSRMNKSIALFINRNAVRLSDAIESGFYVYMIFYCDYKDHPRNRLHSLKLIYAGVSVNPIRRVKRHGYLKNKNCFAIAVWSTTDREFAYALEYDIISCLEPIFNRIGRVPTATKLFTDDRLKRWKEEKARLERQVYAGMNFSE